MPIEAWEDYRAGMYGTTVTPGHVRWSRQLLCEPDRFYDTAMEMVRTWLVSATHNVDYLWTGRRAWIGQASCCYAFGSTSAATCQAWGSMTATQQRRANAVADQVIAERSQRAETLF